MDVLRPGKKLQLKTSEEASQDHHQNGSFKGSKLGQF
jgi:hypothetical protein